MLQSASIADGGEVFLLDMGKEVRIFDMAKKIIKLSGYEYDSPNKVNSIDIEITGLRPGEKLHEELLIDGDLKPTTIKKIYCGDEEFMKMALLRTFLGDLLEKCDAGDDLGVMKVLEKLVSGYVPELLKP